MVKLSVGSKLPRFSLPDQDGTMVSSSDFAGKWVVLYFYPKDDTPGCTIEAIDFSKLNKDFARLGVEVIGVSANSTKSHCKFIKKHDLKLRLLSDESTKVLERFGVWGKKKFMGREYMGVLRSTLVIGPDGKIAFVWRDVNVKGHAQEVLEKVRTLKK